MAHIDQINFIKEFIDFYINNGFINGGDVIEIGSLDINGSIRDEFNFPKREYGNSKWNFGLKSRLKFSKLLINYFFTDLFFLKSTYLTLFIYSI